AGHPVSLSDDCGGHSHSDAIRAICFSVSGALFASAGDDKLVKVWKTDSWRCIQTITSEKRVSAVVISNDDLYVSFADKFGVVWLVTLREDSAEQVSVDNKPVSILGHYCSIITSMKFSPDGRFIATADRDFKIRVTLFPKNPLKGAHEIQSFCLGHTDFVSCITFTSISENQSFLISGGGDSTVRLWDYVNGCLLDTFQAKDKMAELLGPNETDDSSLAITDICPSNDGSLVAVAIQSFSGIMLLACDLVGKKLSFLKLGLAYKQGLPLSLQSFILFIYLGQKLFHASLTLQIRQETKTDIT
ncbi:hypothetical protein ACJX0J_023250, partial [Zea mays]